MHYVLHNYEQWMLLLESDRRPATAVNTRKDYFNNLQ